MDCRELQYGGQRPRSFLESPFPHMFFQRKIYPQRSVHRGPQCVQQIGSDEVSREEQGKLDQKLENWDKKKRERSSACLMQKDLKIWSPNGCKRTPDKSGWEQPSAVILFIRGEDGAQTEISLVTLSQWSTTILWTACYKCCICIPLSCFSIHIYTYLYTHNFLKVPGTTALSTPANCT